MKIADLNIRDRANEGRKYPIPDIHGKPTGAHITLRHAMSDMGRAGRNLMQQRVPEVLGGVDDALIRAQLHNELVAEALAYLVVDWTLEDECTLKSAKELFLAAPYLIDWVDGVTSKADDFFVRASASLKSTPGRGRASKSQPVTEAA